MKNKNWNLLIINVILSIIINISSLSAKSNSFPVTTLINTKWERTPLILEIAEYLSDENSNLYWDYVEEIVKLDDQLEIYDTEQKQYQTALNSVENILSKSHLPLLKLSLSMHSLSPRIQTHLQLSNEMLINNKCNINTFITINDKFDCTKIDNIEKMLKTNIIGETEIYSFDHVYPGTENFTNTLVLYGELGTKNFQKYHNYIKSLLEGNQFKYIQRHYVANKMNEKIRLSGYGVELYLKSTEYKSQDDSPKQDKEINEENIDNNENEIDGFNFIKLKEHYPKLMHSLERFKMTLIESNEEIAPLKAWEFQELGMQASQRVVNIQGDESLQILQYTVNNFPTQAKSLLHTVVSQDFKNEMKHNIEILGRNLNLQPPDSAIFINGIFFDGETLDIGILHETIRNELYILNGLEEIGINGDLASSLLTLDMTTTQDKDYAIDIRDSSITWLNDIENDAQYRRWPSSVMDLLRPAFPGMLRNIRKNIFNLVLVIDPIIFESRSILKLVESFIMHTAPIRVGISFDLRSANDNNFKDYLAVLTSFNYIAQQKTPRDALSFLTDIFSMVQADKQVTYNDVKVQLKKQFSILSANEIDDIINEDSDYDYGRKLTTEFIERIGIKVTPIILLNGVPLLEINKNLDDFEEIILTEIMQQTVTIQKLVFRGELSDNDIIIDYLMKQNNVMPRLNQRILNNKDLKDVKINYLDLSGKPADINNINLLKKLTNRDMTATLLNNIKYFSNNNKLITLNNDLKINYITILVVCDLDELYGRKLLENALTFMKENRGIRIAFIPNVEGSKINKKNNINRLVWAATHTLDQEELITNVENWLREYENSKNYKIPNSVNNLLSSTELHLKLLRVYCQRVLKVNKSEKLIIVNGRIYGPLDTNEIFTIDDYNLIERYINNLYLDKIMAIFKNYNDFDNYNIKMDDDKLLYIITILLSQKEQRNRFAIPKELKEDFSVIKLLPKSNDNSKLYFNIISVLDPASKNSQKLISILILLRQIINCNMKIYLCPIDKHSDMPIKNFYRYVIEPELQFTKEGKLKQGPVAKFSGLPKNVLLTQNLQIPDNWLVEIIRSVYDLDNIKLNLINGPVHSEYELEYLLLEGHCFDSNSGSPPRGLQITLGSNDKPIIVDTIVMANLGYFQLKANPGVWLLKLRHGKSADIYDITSAEGPNTIHSPEGTRVIINSLKSHVLKLRVTKKPGQLSADLLGEESDASNGIWNSITSSLVGGSDDGQPETINIFSVASGHLYERLLRIMMLSLLKHTKSPVKFWFLKNYLSPQFTDFLPLMSKEYNFDYELVQYKWPRWLHQQTEKQRTIWGYKILFLDVLFPLDVKKIIFVDADAIVRADVKELNEMDLDGAPYAYTPFCDSRKDIEGFRFWKQGYWRNHLQGRKYHISALYVVDLKRFRKIAAGDRLRGQYQALSQDPNSLSNLDQDLPNNMIHQVAIKSLPQEWLWCQTWCSDDQLKHAKAIDLCNNPQTKEAKLTAAQRIVPEWKDYDQEIKNLMTNIELGEIHHEENHEATDKPDPRDEL